MLREKKKINFWINIVFSLYLFIPFVTNLSKHIIDMVKEYNVAIANPELINQVQNITTSQIITGVLILFFINLFTTLFKNIFIIILFIGIKLGLKHVKKDKLTDIDFAKYKGYYRDIIKDYSPAVLSYIDDFEIENKDIIATLLDLKLKNYIDINNTEIQILNKNFENLNEVEKYLIQNLNNYNMITFKNLVINEATRQGLLESKNDIKKKIKKKVITLVSVFISLIILSQFLFKYLPQLFSTITITDSNIIIIVFAFLLLAIILFFGMLYPFFSIIYLSSYVLGNIITPYRRTKKGNEINEMLEGLKNYIKDFSMLKERKSEELALWNEYLIYSVLFKQNQNIVKEFEHLKY